MEKWLLIIFYIITGLSLCGAGLPRWVNIIGGVCGIIVAILMI